MNDGVVTEKLESNRVHMEYDHRDKHNISMLTKNAAYMYAYRPLADKRAPELAYLSLYDFSAIGV